MRSFFPVDTRFKLPILKIIIGFIGCPSAVISCNNQRCQIVKYNQESRRAINNLCQTRDQELFRLFHKLQQPKIRNLD